MIIDNAIVATDNNPLYYEFWPVVALGWKNIGIKPIVAVVGDLNLNYAYGTIVKIPALPHIPTGFIAQVIRLIIPCLFPDQVSVTGDIDMIPLSKDYFTRNISQYDEESIIIFSADAYKTELRYPMCYIAAKGKYFQQIIGLKDTSLPTIHLFIEDLYALNLNWDTDELFFARQLSNSPLLKNAVFLERGGWKPFAKARIDRVGWKYSKPRLFLNGYIDAHSLRPMHAHTRQLKDIVEYIGLGSDGARYCSHLLKKPLKVVYSYLLLKRQNIFDQDFFSVSKKISQSSEEAKQVISFSLYGNEPRYLLNLENTIDSYQTMLPGWLCRLYVAADVDPDVINLLVNKGCEVNIMTGKGIDSRYTFWRFLAIEDDQADAVIIRDIDSYCTKRESLMINQWLKSDHQFHIIRDHINHDTRILAGMCGIKANDIAIRKALKKFLMVNKYDSDQEFLKEIVYPQIKNNVLIHDSFPRYPDENPVVIPFDNGEDFIGAISIDEAEQKSSLELSKNWSNYCITLK